MFKPIVALMFSVLATTATAQSMDIECGPTKTVIALLEKYAEKPIIKLDFPEAPSMVLFANSSTETWTIVHVEVNRGESCVVAAGVGVKVVNQKKGKSI